METKTKNIYQTQLELKLKRSKNVFSCITNELVLNFETFTWAAYWHLAMEIRLFRF